MALFRLSAPQYTRLVSPWLTFDSSPLACGVSFFLFPVAVFGIFLPLRSRSRRCFYALLANRLSQLLSPFSFKRVFSCTSLVLVLLRGISFPQKVRRYGPFFSVVFQGCAFPPPLFMANGVGSYTPGDSRGRSIQRLRCLPSNFPPFKAGRWALPVCTRVLDPCLEVLVSPSICPRQS